MAKSMTWCQLDVCAVFFAGHVAPSGCRRRADKTVTTRSSRCPANFAASWCAVAMAIGNLREVSVLSWTHHLWIGDFPPRLIATGQQVFSFEFEILLFWGTVMFYILAVDFEATSMIFRDLMFGSHHCTPFSAWFEAAMGALCQERFLPQHKYG